MFAGIGFIVGLGMLFFSLLDSTPSSTNDANKMTGKEQNKYWEKIKTDIIQMNILWHDYHLDMFKESYNDIVNFYYLDHPEIWKKNLAGFCYTKISAAIYRDFPELHHKECRELWAGGNIGKIIIWRYVANLYGLPYGGGYIFRASEANTLTREQADDFNILVEYIIDSFDYYTTREYWDVEGRQKWLGYDGKKVTVNQSACIEGYEHVEIQIDYKTNSIITHGAVCDFLWEEREDDEIYYNVTKWKLRKYPPRTKTLLEIWEFLRERPYLTRELCDDISRTWQINERVYTKEKIEKMLNFTRRVALENKYKCQVIRDVGALPNTINRLIMDKQPCSGLWYDDRIFGLYFDNYSDADISKEYVYTVRPYEIFNEFIKYNNLQDIEEYWVKSFEIE